MFYLPFLREKTFISNLVDQNLSGFHRSFEVSFSLSLPQSKPLTLARAAAAKPLLITRSPVAPSAHSAVPWRTVEKNHRSSHDASSEQPSQGSALPQTPPCLHIP